jgi:phosphatidylglycerol:prolipoprotein diacylglycerol transferase
LTVSLTEIADALRWLWFGLALVWIGYGWLYRVPYRRILVGIGLLVVLDFLLHAFADFAERPASNIPSDFSLYSILILVAALVGVTAAILYAHRRGITTLTVLTAALVCAVAAGLGGRAYQVWTNWNFYSENTDLIAELAHGGFGIRGALVCGFLALLVFSLVTRTSFWTLADAAAVGLTLAQAIGWYGAALTHYYYGIALDAPAVPGIFAPLAQFVRSFGYNFVQDLPDAYNLIAFRVPVQLLAALFYLVLFIILLWLARKRETDRSTRLTFDGVLFLAYILFASAAGFLFGFWRGDETLMWNDIRMDQWIDLMLFTIGIALAVGRYASVLQRERMNSPERRMSQPA